MSVLKRKNSYRIIGFMLIVIGMSMLPSLFTSIVCKEPKQTLSFSATIVSTIVSGFFILLTFPISEEKTKARDGFFIVSLCWILASLIGAVPAFASGTVPSYVDSFFETCSGFTTTGASVISTPEALPKSILLWRSTAVWLGGAGIILFTAFVLPFSKIEGQKSARQEMSLQRVGKLSIRLHGTVLKLFRFYLFLSASLVFLLYLGKMRFFDALIHGLSIIGTGGFSSFNTGMEKTGTPFINLITIAFMIIVGSNLNLWIRAKKYGMKVFYGNKEFKFYILAIIAVSVLIAANTYAAGIFRHLHDAAMSAFFQVSSMASTTGQHISDINKWPTFSKMLLLSVMLIGGCTSSLAGGPKFMRILVSLKLIRRGISKRLHPNRVFIISLDRRELPQEVVTNIANFMFLYFFMLFSGCILLSINGFDLVTTFSGVIACLNNIGIGFNLIGPAGNFADFSGFSKSVLSVLMIAGRLELFTLLMLFSPHYWNADRV